MDFGTVCGVGLNQRHENHILGFSHFEHSHVYSSVRDPDLPSLTGAESGASQAARKLGSKSILTPNARRKRCPTTVVGLQIV